MGDVFGGLGEIRGGLGDVGSTGPKTGRQALDGLEAALDGAALWGLELDPKFRVLAGTFEPTVQRYAWGEADDRRIQVLCFPVSTILASLRRDTDGAKSLLSFSEEQLVDVVAAFDGARVDAPLFGQPEPQPGSWGPRFSLEGRSSAPDGTARTISLRLSSDELRLDLFARFDEIELKDANGRNVALPSA